MLWIQIELYKDNLNKLLQTKEGYFIIFEETKTKKFVQFQASPKAKQLLLDVPNREQGLSDEQIEKLNSLLVFECDSVELFSREDPFEVSFINRTDYAAEIIERIFLEVFNLPNDYILLCQLNKVMIPEIKEQITEIKSWSENHCNLILNHCNQCNHYLLDVAIY